MQQKNKLAERSHLFFIRDNGNRIKSEMYRNLRRQYQEEGRKLARKKDSFHMAGCMLYWAEGAKNKNTIKLTNMDIEMLKFFIKFLIRSYGVSKRDITLHIYCYLNNGVSQRKIENYWVQELGLTRNNLRKSVVDNYPKSSQRKHPRNKHIYGACHLTVHSTKITQSIYGAIQEYCNFDRSEWLNC